MNRIGVAVLFLMAWFSARAEQYVRISAEVETYEYRRGDTNNISGKATFLADCIVGLQHWRVDNNYSRNADVCWFFDGTNIINTSRISRALPPEVSQALRERFSLTPSMPEKTSSNSMFRVYSLAPGVPLGDVGVNIPWLAYCSGSYLKVADQRIPMPFTEFGGHSAAATSNPVVTFADDLGLPKAIEIVSHPDHSPLLRYVVAVATNIGGWNVPLEFHLLQFQRTQGGGTAVAYGATGKVLSITPSEPPPSPLTANSRQTIVDYRFKDMAKGVDAIVYQFTNSVLWPTSNPALQKLLRQSAAAVPSKPMPGVSKGVVISTLVVVAVGPLVLSRVYHKPRKEQIE
jgi:hypothetical protein